MKIHRIFVYVSILFILLSTTIYAQVKLNKKIYIKPFQLDENIDELSIADEVRDYMSEVLVNEFSVISDDEIKEYLKNTELKQGIGGNVNLEKLIKAINVDYLLYGQIYKENQLIVIEASLMTLEDGRIYIKNKGRIEIFSKDHIDRASRALAKYLIIDRNKIGKFFGEDDPIKEFREDVNKFESELEKIEKRYQSKSIGIQKASEWRDNSLMKSPLIRIGYSGFGMFTSMNDYINKLYEPQHLAFLDMFLYRYKDPVGDGVDIFARGTFRNYKAVEDYKSIVKISEDTDIGYFSQIPLISPELNILSLDAGIRFVGSVYVIRSAMSFYISFAGRYNYSIEKFEYTDGPKKRILKKWGFIGGSGVEISLIPYLGIFAECNAGYVPMGRRDINMEGFQILFGIMFRTQHWDI